MTPSTPRTRAKPDETQAEGVKTAKVVADKDAPAPDGDKPRQEKEEEKEGSRAALSRAAIILGRRGSTARVAVCMVPPVAAEQAIAGGGRPPREESPSSTGQGAG